MTKNKPTGKYLYYKGEKYYDRCVLGEKVTSIEEVIKVPRFYFKGESQKEIDWLNEKCKELFVCNEGEEVWWYDDIRFLSGTAGLVKIKEDQIIRFVVLLMS